MKCPKCSFEQDGNTPECVRCGVVFTKYEAQMRKKEQVNSRYSPTAQTDADSVTEDAAAGATIITEAVPPLNHQPPSCQPSTPVLSMD